MLADTSVWLDHWRRPIARFATLLESNEIVVHPFIVGEIALGDISPRAEILRGLGKLHATTLARHEEVHELIERIPLWGRGIGWVDAHLLASALLDRVRLWTFDRNLAHAAVDIGVAA
ncbi:MAG: type II toxin-antitoxin system VapC family toxin [Gemmatimonadales bacterium]